MSSPISSTSPHASIAAIGDRLGFLSVQHFEGAFRQILKGKGVSCDQHFVRLRTGQPHPFGNFTLVSDIRHPTVNAEVDALCLPDAPTAMLFLEPVPASVQAHLAKRGFGNHGPMPAMAVEIDRLNPTKVPAGCELERVGAGSKGTIWEETFALGYELPQPVAAYFAPNQTGATTEAGAELQFYLVTFQGRPVATSAVILRDGLAGIYCVATLPEERKKGFGAFATAEPLRLMRDLGYRVGVLQSSDSGHPVYRRLGFEDVGNIGLHIRMPGPIND